MTLVINKNKIKCVCFTLVFDMIVNFPYTEQPGNYNISN